MSNMNVLMHNTVAMFSGRQLGITNTNRAKSSEKLSSGFKINRAADDAAGLTISEKMRYYIRGLRQGTKNIQEGVGLCQVADGALNEVHDMLHRMTELSIKGANGTLTNEDRTALDSEADAIKEEMRRIFNTTEFNEHKIFVLPYVPEVSGLPDDFKVYNLDVDNKGSSGGDNDIRYGGLEIDNIRMTWDEIGLSSFISDDGKTWDNIPYNPMLGGNVLEIKLDNSNNDYDPYNKEDVILRVTQGDKLEELQRVYTWKADGNGIYINNLFAKTWDELGVTEKGKDDGIITFDWHGVNYRFETGSDNKQDIITGVNGDLTDGHIFTAGLSDNPAQQAVRYAFDLTKAVTQSGVNNKTLAEDDYKIYADDQGVTIVLQESAKDRDKDSTDVQHTFIKWEDFKDVNDNNFPILDFGIENRNNNPLDANQTFSENSVYKYRDEKTGIEFAFTIRDESSMEAVINSLNNNNILETYYTPGSNTGSTSTNGDRVSVPISTDSIIYKGLSSLRLQKELGRNFDEPATNFEFNMSKKVSSVTDLQQTDADSNGVTREFGPIKKLNDVTTDNIDKVYKLENGTYTIYQRTKIKEGTQTDILENYKHYVQDVNFEYAGTFNKTGEEIIVSDGSTQIRYTDTHREEHKYNLTYDTYVKIGTSTKVGDTWHISNEDGYETTDSEMNTMHEDTYSGTDGEHLRDDLGITVTETRSINSDSGYDTITTNLEYTNATRRGSVFLSENPSVNTHLFDATYTYSNSAIANYFLDNNRNIYGRTNVGIEDPTRTDSSKITVTANKASVNYSATALEPGNRVREPEYGRLQSIMPEKELIIQAGDDEPNDITLKWHGMSLSSIGLSGVSMKTQESSKIAISAIQDALDLVSEERSIFGAHQNRLEHAMRINDNTAENLEDAESRIRDTDMAEEMVRFSKDGILQQVGQSMLAQANQQRQGILSLLQ